MICAAPKISEETILAGGVGQINVIATVAVWRAGATPQPVAMRLTDAERSAVEEVSRPAAAIGARPQDPSIPWIESVDAPAVSVPLPDLAASSWKAPTTSGSTGRPKVVRASSPAILDPTRPVAEFLPLRATQLVSGPMTHSATFTYAFRGLLTGHRLVILPRFDERAWLDAVEEHAVTWALVVPTMMHRLLRLPEAERHPDRLRSIESLLHMGAPCAVPLKRLFLHWAGAERVIAGAAFICSDLASGITGEIMYVDGGFNTTTIAHSPNGNGAEPAK